MSKFKEEGLIRQLARTENEKWHYRRLIKQSRKRHGDRDRRKEEEQKRLSQNVEVAKKV